MRGFFCLFILVLTVVIVSCAENDRFDDEIHSLGYSSMSRSRSHVLSRGSDVHREAELHLHR